MPECDLETSTMRRPWLTRGCRFKTKLYFLTQRSHVPTLLNYTGSSCHEWARMSPLSGRRFVGFSVYWQWNISLNHNPFYDVQFVVSVFMHNVVSGIIFNPETSCQVSEATSKTKLSAVWTEECAVESKHITFTLQSIVLSLKFARTYVFRTIPTIDDNDFCLQHLPIGLSIESTPCSLRHEMNPYLQVW